MIQKVHIPSGIFDQELGTVPPYYIMEYQKKLMKELEERLWNVDHFLDRYWDFVPLDSYPKFIIKVD
jgi:hypothetical protein